MQPNGPILPDFHTLAASVVSAFVSNNAVPASELPGLLHSVYAALATLGQSDAAEPAAEKPSAQEIRKSIRPDGLVSFIDGRSYKTLKRHLASHAMTPETYRERYGLPADYPMTAASYSAQRSALAKKTGLGSRGLRPVPAAA